MEFDEKGLRSVCLTSLLYGGAMVTAILATVLMFGPVILFVLEAYASIISWLLGMN